MCGWGSSPKPFRRVCGRGASQGLGRGLAGARAAESGADPGRGDGTKPGRPRRLCIMPDNATRTREHWSLPQGTDALPRAGVNTSHSARGFNTTLHKRPWLERVRPDEHYLCTLQLECHVISTRHEKDFF